MFFGKPILAFDCVYNRESTENKAEYFTSTTDLIARLTNKLANHSENGSAMAEIADRRYRWETISRQYESLF
jgi:glycosyltransferase involved in cell wall biosynthesis